ncbi:MAG: hypothetical protein R2873_36355 [Caldilineaceae bacterium]
MLVNSAHVAPVFAASGAFTSCALDAGSGNVWQTLAWQADLPANTAATVQARTSIDGINWSAWNTVANSGDAVAAVGQFLQYQLLLSSLDGTNTPQVNEVTAVRWSNVAHGHPHFDARCAHCDQHTHGDGN